LVEKGVKVVAVPEVIYQFVPSLGGSFYTRIVPSVSSQLIMGETREMITGEMQYSNSPSGDWTFLSYVPYGLPIVSGY
jgi:hypothetical protein